MSVELERKLRKPSIYEERAPRCISESYLIL